PSRLIGFGSGSHSQPPDPIVSLDFVNVLERSSVGVHVVARELNREEGLVLHGVFLANTRNAQNSASDNTPTLRVRGDTVEDKGDVSRLRSGGVQLRLVAVEVGASSNGASAVGDNVVRQSQLSTRGVDLAIALRQSTLHDVNDLVHLHLGVVLLKLQRNTTIGAAQVDPVARNIGLIEREGNLRVRRLGSLEFALV